MPISLSGSSAPCERRRRTTWGRLQETQPHGAGGEEHFYLMIIIEWLMIIETIIRSQKGQETLFYEGSMP